MAVCFVASKSLCGHEDGDQRCKFGSIFFLNCYNIMTGDIVIKKSSFLPVLETGKSDDCDGRFSAWCGPDLCCVLSKVGMLCA